MRFWAFLSVALLCASLSACTAVQQRDRRYVEVLDANGNVAICPDGLPLAIEEEPRIRVETYDKGEVKRALAAQEEAVRRGEARYVNGGIVYTPTQTMAAEHCDAAAQ